MEITVCKVGKKCEKIIEALLDVYEPEQIIQDMLIGFGYMTSDFCRSVSPEKFEELMKDERIKGWSDIAFAFMEAGKQDYEDLQK